MGTAQTTRWDEMKNFMIFQKRALEEIMHNIISYKQATIFYAPAHTGEHL